MGRRFWVVLLLGLLVGLGGGYSFGVLWGASECDCDRRCEELVQEARSAVLDASAEQCGRMLAVLAEVKEQTGE